MVLFRESKGRQYVSFWLSGYLLSIGWSDAGGSGVWVENCNPLRISDLNLDSDLWWLCHQDSDLSAVRNPGLLVRCVG